MFSTAGVLTKKIDKGRMFEELKTICKVFGGRVFYEESDVQFKNKNIHRPEARTYEKVPQKR